MHDDDDDDDDDDDGWSYHLFVCCWIWINTNKLQLKANKQWIYLKFVYLKLIEGWVTSNHLEINTSSYSKFMVEHN